jgi:zinc/manganese transport system substrate-binding protein
LEAYQAALAELDEEIRAAVARIPPDRRTVVTSHNAFGHFTAAYGLEFVAPRGINPEAEPTAADVAALIRQINDNDIAAVFVEPISDPRLMQQIERETNATFGGTLYSDTLSTSDGPAATYLDMMRHNVHSITVALGR